MPGSRTAASDNRHLRLGAILLAVDSTWLARWRPFYWRRKGEEPALPVLIGRCCAVHASSIVRFYRHVADPINPFFAPFPDPRFTCWGTWDLPFEPSHLPHRGHPPHRTDAHLLLRAHPLFPPCRPPAPKPSPVLPQLSGSVRGTAVKSRQLAAAGGRPVPMLQPDDDAASVALHLTPQSNSISESNRVCSSTVWNIKRCKRVHSSQLPQARSPRGHLSCMQVARPQRHARPLLLHPPIVTLATPPRQERVRCCRSELAVRCRRRLRCLVPRIVHCRRRRTGRCIRSAARCRCRRWCCPSAALAFTDAARTGPSPGSFKGGPSRPTNVRRGPKSHSGRRSAAPLATWMFQYVLLEAAKGGGRTGSKG